MRISSERRKEFIQLSKTLLIPEGKLYPSSINYYQRSAAVTDKIKYKPAEVQQRGRCGRNLQRSPSVGWAVVSVA